MTAPGDAEAFILAQRASWELMVRQARLAQRSAACVTRPETTTTCTHCGTRFADPGTGPPRRYCSPQCRKRYHRTRSNSARRSVQKALLAERDGPLCCYCLTPFAAGLPDATIEHVHGLARHKASNLAALRLACEPCNKMSAWLTTHHPAGTDPADTRARSVAILSAYAAVLCTLTPAWQPRLRGGTAPGLRWAQHRGLAEPHPRNRQWRLTPAGTAIRNHIAAEGIHVLAALLTTTATGGTGHPPAGFGTRTASMDRLPGLHSIGICLDRISRGPRMTRSFYGQMEPAAAWVVIS